MSSAGSTLLNEAAGGAGSGNAISSVSSNTSGSGCADLISASGVAASRLASMESMSSWLLLAAGSGAGGGGGAGFGARAGFGAGVGFGAGAIADGGISLITAGFAAAGGLAGLSAAAGFASSSAMMRRIDARISSIEGSWTFAGCVISDSTSKPFYIKATKELPVPDMQAGIFIALARLVPRSSPPAASRAGPAPPQNDPDARPCDARTRATNRSARPRNGTSWPQLIASKAPGASG